MNEIKLLLVIELCYCDIVVVVQLNLAIVCHFRECDDALEIVWSERNKSVTGDMGYCHRDLLGEVWVVAVVVGGSAGTAVMQAVAHPVMVPCVVVVGGCHNQSPRYSFP